MFRLIGVMLLFSVLSGVVWADATKEIEENEALVMKIIFDDCLGFIEKDETPFQTFDLLPITGNGLETVPDVLHPYSTSKHLFSNRYVVTWGEDITSRFCMVRSVFGTEQPMKLGVDPDGFLERVSTRADALGMTEHDLSKTFKEPYISSWREPGGTGASELRLVVTATGGSGDSSLLDAGIIIMAAGVGRHKLQTGQDQMLWYW